MIEWYKPEKSKNLKTAAIRTFLLIQDLKKTTFRNLVGNLHLLRKELIKSKSKKSYPEFSVNSSKLVLDKESNEQILQ